MKTNLVYILTFCLLILGGNGNAQSSYNQAILDKLIEICKQNKSAQLLVSVNDSLISNHTFYGKSDELYRVYSITKLFSGIAVAILLEKKLIKSPEDKIADYFTDWQSDSIKNRITIRHILQHNSGLYTTKGSKDIYDQSDFVEFALKSGIDAPPGHIYNYNNRAINLIAGLVKKLTGESLESFIRENLFKPLGIQKYIWPSDESGNSWGMDGLRLSAVDLIKVGQLLANYGEWKGQKIFSKKWGEMAYQLPLMNFYYKVGGYGMGLKVLYVEGKFTIPLQNIYLLKEKGLKNDLCDRLYRLSDSTFSDFTHFGNALRANFKPAEIEEINAFSSAQLIPIYKEPDNKIIVLHYGEIGQQLVVFPQKRIVMVRFIDEKWGRKTDKKGNYQYVMDQELLPYLVNLVK
jgi:CubicO group peptidase (beta-lactamase class C family)